MQMESWVGTIEREWHQLRRADPTLDVEKFSSHVLAANKTGFLSPESLAAIANALLTSTLSRAPHLGRLLLERIGANRHPAWRLAMAISLVTPTGMHPIPAHLLLSPIVICGFPVAVTPGDVRCRERQSAVDFSQASISSSGTGQFATLARHKNRPARRL
jgi:hypothetical protein